jgi:hypothetical protein
MKSKFIWICLFSVLTTATAGATKRTELTAALEAKQVKIDITKTNGMLAVTCNNRLRDSLVIDITPGTIFPAGENYQPQVVTRGQRITLASNESQEVRLNVRCGNAPKMAVGNGHQEFGTPYHGDPEMEKQLTAIFELGLDNRSIVAHIIWYYTNGHSLSGLSQGDCSDTEYNAINQILRRNGISEVDPGYRVSFVEPELGSQYAFTDRVNFVEGSVPFVSEGAKDCAMLLTDAQGKIVKMIRYFDQIASGVGESKFKIDATHLSKGNYAVVVKSREGNVLGSLPIEI